MANGGGTQWNHDEKYVFTNFLVLKHVDGMHQGVFFVASYHRKYNIWPQVFETVPATCFHYST